MNIILYYIIEIFKWVPGIIFPISHIIQLIDMYKNYEKKHNLNINLDPLTFLFFYIGNLGAYLFTKKYLSIKVWLAYIIPAIIEIYIYIYYYYVKNNKSKAIIYGLIMSILLVGTIAYANIFQYNKRFIKYITSISEYAGFLPALLFPIGILLQFIKIIKKKSFIDVSMNGWILMIFANIGSYILIEKYTSWKSISAFLLSAIFSLAIVIYIIINT